MGNGTCPTAGRFCGRAVTGISKLSREDIHQIEAHRTRERPTPWAHLAKRYGVNEIDLRQIFEGPCETRLPPAPTPVVLNSAAARQAVLCERDARFRGLWLSGMPKTEISEIMAITFRQMDRMRIRLGLAKRAEGRKPNSWSAAEDAYVLKHYIINDETAEVVSAVLGRTRNAVVGRAHRLGFSRRVPARLAA